MNREEIVKKLSELLVGEYAYGDDGEPATVIAVYMSPRTRDRIFIDIQQDDGIKYRGFDLFNYMDALDVDDNTLAEARELIDEFYS